MPKKKKKTDSFDASPAKSLASEITNLKAGLRQTLKVYGEKLTSDLAEVQGWNSKQVESTKQLSREQARDLGDMLGLLRKLKIKPEKGRRRDLRKIEVVLEDLRELAKAKVPAKAGS